MTTVSVTPGNDAVHHREVGRPHLDSKTHGAGKIGFVLVLLGALGFVGYSILRDTQSVGEPLAICQRCRESRSNFCWA